jgi:hypothetical protein
MMLRTLGICTAIGIAAACHAGSADAQDYKDHLIRDFGDRQVLRTFDPKKRVRDGDVRTEHIQQSAAEGRDGIIIHLRAVDDLVCVKTKPAESREEVCVLSATLSPCVCNYEVSDVADKKSDLGGLSGVVTPNGGTCDCN